MAAVDLSEYRFTETHEWVNVRDGLAYIGITDHAQSEITDVVYVDLPPEGREVKSGDELLMVDSVKASFSIYAPIGGQVARANSALAESPEFVNASPYEDGWLVALQPSDPSEVSALMTEDEYDEFVRSEEE